MAQLSSRRWMVTGIMLILILNIASTIFMTQAVSQNKGFLDTPLSNLENEAKTMTRNSSRTDQDSAVSTTYAPSGYSAMKWTTIAITAFFYIAAGTIIMGALLIQQSIVSYGASVLGILLSGLGLFLVIFTIWIYYEIYVVIFKPKSG